MRIIKVKNINPENNRPLIAQITANTEKEPVYHLCRNCPDFKRIGKKLRTKWQGEDDRKLCDTCFERIINGNCLPILARRNSHRLRKNQKS